jgi:hypothetical protein
MQTLGDDLDENFSDGNVGDFDGPVAVRLEIHFSEPIFVKKLPRIAETDVNAGVRDRSILAIGHDNLQSGGSGVIVRSRGRRRLIR